MCVNTNHIHSRESTFQVGKHKFDPIDKIDLYV